MHLVFNMLSLYFVGNALERAFEIVLGSKWYFPLMYLLGLILPDVYNYFKYKDYSGYASIGASGAVSAALFSCMMFAPGRRYTCSSSPARSSYMRYCSSFIRSICPNVAEMVSITARTSSALF